MAKRRETMQVGRGVSDSDRHFDPERRYRRTHSPDLLKCPNCQQTLRGQFCSRCGQNNRISRLYFGQLLKAFFQESFELEGPLFRTFMKLSTNPGVVCRDYIDGRRRRFMSPIRYFLVIGFVSVLFLTVFGINQAEAFQNVSPQRNDMQVNATVSDRSGLSASEKSELEQRMEERLRWFVSPEGQKDFVDWIQARGPTIQLAVTPLIGVMLMLLYIRKRMTFGEHLVFLLYTKAHLTLISLCATMLTAHKHMLSMLVLVIVVPVLYSAWTARRFYRETWFMALLRQGATHAFLMGLSLLTGFIAGIVYVLMPVFMDDVPPPPSLPAPEVEEESSTSDDAEATSMMPDTFSSDDGLVLVSLVTVTGAAD